MIFSCRQFESENERVRVVCLDTLSVDAQVATAEPVPGGVRGANGVTYISAVDVALAWGGQLVTGESNTEALKWQYTIHTNVFRALMEGTVRYVLE